MNPNERKAERDRLEQEILSGLVGVPADAPVWKSLNLALRFYFTQKQNELLTPGVSSEDRHFLAGASNALVEFEHFIEQKRQKAQAMKLRPEK